jgi:hypothetical protein
MDELGPGSKNSFLANAYLCSIVAGLSPLCEFDAWAVAAL